MIDVPETLTELEPEEFDFAARHALQLTSNGLALSKELVQTLYRKLRHETFDAGESFQLMEDPGEKCFRLMATRQVAPGAEVFLVDHAFSFRYRDLRGLLLKNEELRKRLRSMTKFFAERKTLRDCLFRPKLEEDRRVHPDFDGDEAIVDPRKLELDWANIETLSLCHTGVEEPDMVAEMLNWCPKLKGLWLTGSPVAEGAKEYLMIRYVEELHPNIQIYNSKFTKHSKDWAIKLATFGLNCVLCDEVAVERMRECDISGRNFYALKDDHSVFDRMQEVRTLKARETFFNTFGEANRFIEMIRDMRKLERVELDYYMLDLFWDIKDRIKKLNPSIRYINDYDLGYDKPKPLDEEVDFIVDNIWKITQSYKLVVGENIDTEPVFYVLDEVGSALTHSESPNFICFPFIYFRDSAAPGEGKTYNLLCPVRQIEVGEFASRNYVLGCSENQKKSILGIWNTDHFQTYIDKHRAFSRVLEERAKLGGAVVSRVLEEQKSGQKVASVWSGSPVKVFTDSELLRKAINDNRFQVVSEVQQAQVLHATQNLKQYREHFGDKLDQLVVNQFPFEGVFANKRFLSEAIKKHLGFPEWLAETYDLETELEEFVGEYMHRKSFNLENYWITKPVDMTRSIDMTVSNNLDLILRVAGTGPKIVCKYVENPLRYRGVKFDLRQYLLVRSLQPLEVYMHKDFLVRAAANDFTMDKRRLFQNETHFVYNPVKQKMNQLFDYKEFVASFGKKFGTDWAVVQQKIVEVVKSALAVCVLEVPGLQAANARALYGIDVILDADLQPKLMEITFSPNLESILAQNSSFFDDVLRCLYLGEESRVVRIL